MSPTIPNNIPEALAPLTTAEESLLKLYAKVKSYEKEATKAAAEAARARLVAADEKYKRDTAQQGSDNDTSRVHSRSSKVSKNQSYEMETPGMEDQFRDTVGDYESEEEKVTKAQVAKLREARDKEQAPQREKDNKRQKYLTPAAPMDDGPTIKKKELDYRGDTSLIANMEGQSTPLHDFSKSLAMSKVSGSQLFPDPIDGSNTGWEPLQTASHPDEGCLELLLEGFDMSQASVGSGNNTVAIKFAAPTSSKRFSINIAGPKHEHYSSVLFHFNPRQFEKGGLLVINDKQEGTWGQAINIPLSTLGLIFGQQSNTLIIQINGDGFDVFLDGQHCARLEVRSDEKSTVIFDDD